MPDSSGSIDLGSLPKEDQEALAAMAEEHPPEEEEDKPKVLTAFSVVVGYDGDPQIVAYAGDDLLVQSNPTDDLIKGACRNIVDDLNVLQTAQASAHMTAQLLMQQGQQMQQQMMQQQEAARIAASLDLPGARR